MTEIRNHPGPYSPEVLKIVTKRLMRGDYDFDRHKPCREHETDYKSLLYIARRLAMTAQKDGDA